MTEQEAKALVEWFKVRKGKTLKLNDDGIDCVIEALEKQIAKKIFSSCKIENAIGGYCPNCGGTVEIAETWLVQTKGQHCSWCGQKLDWE